MIAAPAGALSPNTAFHTGLSEAQLRGGHIRRDVVDAFARFLQPTDIVASWGHYSPNLFVAAGGTLPGERLDLRMVAQRLLQRRAGSLDVFAESLPGAPLVLVPGRGGRRLDAMARIVASWRTL